LLQSAILNQGVIAAISCFKFRVRLGNFQPH
jgi:hypothetical protein